MKKWIAGALATVLMICAAGCATKTTGVSQEDYDALNAQFEEVQSQYDKVQKDLDELQSDFDEQSEKFEKLKKEHEDVVEEYNQYKEETADFAALTEDERKAELARAEKERIEAEEEARKAQEEADRLAAERAAEEEARKQAEEEARLAEEAKGYETGITYKQLARTPDEYKGKKVKFQGTVLQVIEGDDENQGRLATKDGYDDVIYFGYDPDLLDVRLLEDDVITIYGTSIGVYSYTTVMGATVTLPAVWIDRIEIHE